ncbi:hypothetical protein [uncultured Leifsonia sp.]|uniref:hypothetical protein n=1 Tax=uncultured Leifsonia sp. TaxID=340359 RepID=UPI0028D2031A|nr:hypothetical protein [uncultured Leifsonia sp.]
MAELTVAQLAERLQIGARYARSLAETGALSARQLPSGDWLVDSDAVARYALRRRTAGRRLDADTAWALLYELSGIAASALLPPATYARVRKRIRTMTAEDIAVAVADRTRQQRYRAANGTMAQAGLIGTGRVAADLIAGDLLPDARRVAGYVPPGSSLEEYARTHFMVADPSGTDVLYENTAPGRGYTEPLPAVVAADLALSTDTRERSAGLDALTGLKDAWLASRTR